MNKLDDLKQEILEKVKKYHDLKFQKKDFIENETFINYGGRYFDSLEMMNLVDSSLDFWLTSGKWAKEFETKIAKYLNVKYANLVNSGSSANLIAFYALTSKQLNQRRINKGDEVITVACSFPTTVAPIIQYGAIPVFVDVDIETLNIDTNLIEKAISNKTKAIMIAHTLGNPFDVKKVREICDKYNLWLIEDNCDGLGSEVCINSKTHKTGSFGDIATSSFYPPHHITMGEGGCVYTNNALLNKIIKSFRDWGRDCFCESGKDNTCKMRFTKKYGNLPLGYDHKYVYSHFGYNLKITDMQAAIGVAQLDKLDYIVKARRNNFDKLYEGLKHLEDKLYFLKHLENCKPSWFGFPMTIKDLKYSRLEFVKYLEDHKIQTRNLFAGNIIKHPCFDELIEGKDYKISSKLDNTDYVMNNTLWIGVYPGISDEMINYIVKTISNYFI